MPEETRQTLTIGRRRRRRRRTRLAWRTATIKATGGGVDLGNTGQIFL